MYFFQYQKKLRKVDNPSEFIEGFEKIPEIEKLKEAKKMTLRHFKRMSSADIVYIITKNGYVGKTVSSDCIFKCRICIRKR